MGDLVCVKPDVEKPKHNWSMISHKSIGNVKEIREDVGDIVVDFQEQKGWIGAISDMMVVYSKGISLFEELYYLNLAHSCGNG